MLRLMILLVCFLFASSPNATKAQENPALQFRLPDPAITALHLDSLGHAVRVEFADGGSVSYPVEISQDEMKNIDLIDIYTIPFELIIMRDLREGDEEYGPISERIHFFSHWFISLFQEMNFKDIIRFDPETGEMLTQKGQSIVDDEQDNLFDNSDFDRSEMIDIYTFRLIEYVDLKDGYKKRKILRLSISE